jgi:hypothetical protein
MEGWNERRHILDYDSAVALRYHGRRKEFLNALSRLDPALSVIFGAAAFGTLMKGLPNIAAACAVVVAATSAINLAFGLSDRARLHEDLFRRWGDVRGDLAELVADDDIGLRLLEVKRAKIDAESPWQLAALSALCENEEKEVRRTGPLVRIGRVQRILANWLTLPGWHPDLVSDAAPPDGQARA